MPPAMGPEFLLGESEYDLVRREEREPLLDEYDLDDEYERDEREE